MSGRSEARYQPLHVPSLPAMVATTLAGQYLLLKMGNLDIGLALTILDRVSPPGTARKGAVNDGMKRALSSLGDVNGLYGDQPTTSGSSKPVNDGAGEIITLGSIGFCQVIPSQTDSHVPTLR